jgi:DNA-binding transcriptional MerR regulator
LEEKKTYSIVEVAEMLGLAQSTIRKYEEDYNIRIKRNELGRREYTQLDIDVLRSIQDLKKEGYNIFHIRRALNNNPEAVEQKEKSLEATNIYDMNGAEVYQLMKKSFEESVTSFMEQQKKEFEVMREEMREELQKEFEKQAEQTRSENQKLMDYIQRSRDEKEQTKGFWSRILRK